MPTYGYQCTRCENAFEVVQKMSDDPLTICGNCGGELQKKIYPVGIAFKGSGFYVNDYSSKKPATEASTPASTTTETKPEPAAPVAASTEGATPIAPATPVAAAPKETKATTEAK